MVLSPLRIELNLVKQSWPNARIQQEWLEGTYVNMCRHNVGTGRVSRAQHATEGLVSKCQIINKMHFGYKFKKKKFANFRKFLN